MKKFFVMAMVGALAVLFTACGDDGNKPDYVSCSGETMCSCGGTGTTCQGGRWIECENSEVVEVIPDSPKCK